jgi:uncharacterized membrane protein YozB (DUF420 family)
VVQLTDLPGLNAILNATSAALLITGYYYIRQRNIRAHRRCMVSAFAVSIFFLLSYLTYHYHVGATRFGGQGYIRPVYFTILISHTILAGLVPFFALLTLWRAWNEQFRKHKRIARWALPIWLYVSATGVVIYWMLYQLPVNS